MFTDSFRRGLVAVAAVIMLGLAVQPAAAVEKTDLIRSLILPGLGQAHSGHYTKAAMFASAAVISTVGLFAAQINYDRSVERFDNLKREYNTYDARLSGGEVISITEINQTYADMDEAWNSAEDRVKWRNIFLGALVATYALNVVDIIMSEPDSGEIYDTSSKFQLEVQPNRIGVVRSISF